MGILRSTFLIALDVIFAHAWSNIMTKDRAGKVLSGVAGITY